MTEKEAMLVNPLELAFVGDAVYSLYVREKLVKGGEGQLNGYQRTASKIVSAVGQSAFTERLCSVFTEEEKEIFRRARNAKKPTKAKNAPVADYARSTGFEAVVGFLYLTDKKERLNELFSLDNEDNYRVSRVEKELKP